MAAVLMDPDTPVEPFRPRPVEDLSSAEWSRLRSRLAGAVAGWRRSTETGLRLDEMRRVAGEPPSPEGVWYVAGGVPLALCLDRTLSAALVCLSLGSPPPDEPQDKLTETDLAVLDVWAREAVPEVAGALDASAGPPTRVTAAEAAELMRGEEPLAVGDLRWASGRPGGAVVVARALARSDAEADGRALADYPDALLRAPVAVDAVVAGPELPLAELLSLEAGDVVLLGLKSEVQVTLSVGGTAAAVGRPGVQGGKMAVRITRGPDTTGTFQPLTGSETSDGGRT
ncbi:MAG: FliM/FliN family flagellar motor C-terminal domain-containing protein [Armatimonadota bacterium]|nr:FliM/FliN family flagellar motor C-terminal domain-containing protein [Armatimonadota bacterium]